MSAYKRLNKQDAYITTYTAKKEWSVTGSELVNYGIDIIEATGSYLNSIQQLYYPNKDNGNVVSHSYDYYNQTTLSFPDSRTLVSGSIIFSIPRDLIGTHMDTGYGMELNISTSTYVLNGYWQEDYVREVTLLPELSLRDDAEGNLYDADSSPRRYVGDIIYPHGIVILTDSEYIDFLRRETINYLQWKSTYPIYTHTYHCRVKESEYNFTTNPSAMTIVDKTGYDNEGNLYSNTVKSLDGTLRANVTGSDFQPYITTIGLYNDTNELIAVGKLSQPVPKSMDTEMTITVKIDI